jgi:lysophospholipase L1-like esterase
VEAVKGIVTNDEQAGSSEPERARPRSAKREWGFRIAASVAVPLVFLTLLVVVAECWCRTFLGPVHYPLPGVEEAAHYLYFSMPEAFHPLFVLEDGPEPVFRTAEKLYTGDGFYVQDQTFPAVRTPEAVRVAFIGGSSVQGWPYRAESIVFPALTGRRLQAKFPDRRIDVINAGVGSYNSFQLAGVVDQMDAFKVDVLVIYAGHNDQGYYFFYKAFLDGYGSGGTTFKRALNKLQCYQHVRKWRDKKFGRASDGSVFGGQVEPGKGDVPKKFQAQDENIFQLDPESQSEYDPGRYAELVAQHERLLPGFFETNLTKLVTMAKASGMHVILAKPAGNLRDYQPRLNLHYHPDQMTRADLKEFDSLMARAKVMMVTGGVAPRDMTGIEANGQYVEPGHEPQVKIVEGSYPLGHENAVHNCKAVLPVIERALAISDTWAEAHFLRGACLLHSDHEAAREALIRARDLSPAQAPRQRAPTYLLDVIDAVGAAQGVPVVDIPQAFADQTETGIPGADLFVDNLHFNGFGHRVTADALAEAIAKLPPFTQGTAGRAPDPEPSEVVRILEEKKKDVKWGMGVVPAGVGEGLEGEGDYGPSP